MFHQGGKLISRSKMLHHGSELISRLKMLHHGSKLISGSLNPSGKRGKEDSIKKRVWYTIWITQERKLIEGVLVWIQNTSYHTLRKSVSVTLPKFSFVGFLTYPPSINAVTHTQPSILYASKTRETDTNPHRWGREWTVPWEWISVNPCVGAALAAWVLSCWGRKSMEGGSCSAPQYY